MPQNPEIFSITNDHLTIPMLEKLVRSDGAQYRVELSDGAVHDIQACRDFLDKKLEEDTSPIYGINTGFGFLYNTIIAKEDLEQLQLNLVRSHACGVGEPVPEEIARLMLLLKAKSISFGHSGVALETTQRLIDLYNHHITPVVPTQGSLGASGDLAPLAHLCLPLLGEGEVFYQGTRMGAAEALKKAGLTPITLRSKEGLGLLNGTQFMLAYGVYSIHRTRRYSYWSDFLAALSLDAFDGRIDPFRPELHAIRPHPGQIRTAGRIRLLLEGSEILNRTKVALQDPYSFRCVPQVHGASKDFLDFCEGVFDREVNSTTDNPNIFLESGQILSGGNFHGQPLALALDSMAIALAELGSISERRVFQLLSGSRGLPLFLVANPGLNSGLMIAQYSAASMVSQNKQLCTPAVVDSIPSSNGQEDHVSMGANAALKAFRVLHNLRRLLAIELITASQALWFRRPLKTGQRLQEIVDAFREVVPPVEQDRILATDIERAAEFIDSWDYLKSVQTN